MIFWFHMVDLFKYGNQEPKTFRTAAAAEDFFFNKDETNLCEKMYLHVWKRRIKVRVRNKAEKQNADSTHGWAKVKDLRGEDEFEER